METTYLLKYMYSWRSVQPLRELLPNPLPFTATACFGLRGIPMPFCPLELFRTDSRFERMWLLKLTFFSPVADSMEVLGIC